MLCMCAIGRLEFCLNLRLVDRLSALLGWVGPISIGLTLGERRST